MHKGSHSLSTLPTLIVFCLLCNSHPNRRAVLSHCDLICIPLMAKRVQHLFRCLLAMWTSSLEKYVCGSPLSVLKRSFLFLWLLICSFLWNPDINYYQIYDFHSFSHSTGCLFTLVLDVFNFDVVQCTSFSICCLWFSCHIQGIVANANVV